MRLHTAILQAQARASRVSWDAQMLFAVLFEDEKSRL